MKFSIITLFPEMFEGPFDHSILKNAQKRKLISIELVNLRRFGIGKHKIIDDKPYGGGVGMVMRPDVIQKAIEHTKCHPSNTGKKCKERVILLDPQGKLFSQKGAKELTKFTHLILICGRYEGVDERVRRLIDEEISIGDYILTGGEIPAMVLTDTISRLLSGVLGKDQSSVSESFQKFIIDNKNLRILEYPQYTKPADFKGLKVPRILLSGNHTKIAQWRKTKAFERTKKRRPDLLTPLLKSS